MKFLWLLNYSNVILKISEQYGILVPPREYALVFDAVPSGVVMLLTSYATSKLSLLPQEPAVPDVGRL